MLWSESVKWIVYIVATEVRRLNSRESTDEEENGGS